MNQGVWLLLRLRFQGRVRRFVHGLRSPRGIVFAVVGIAVLLTWLLPSLLISETLTAEDLAEIRRLGPLALLGFSLMNVLFSSSEGGIAFSAAEVNFLFPAPLTRRQLLIYKILGNLGGAFFSALFVTIFVRRFSVFIFAAFVAVILILTFMQLLGMLLTLLANTLGAIAYNRQRRIIIGLLAVFVVVVAYQTGAEWWQRDWYQLLNEIVDNPVVRFVLAPMQWFINALTAERLSDLAFWAMLAAVVNGVLVLVIFSLDAHYLEASAAASEKVYARLQRLRQGGGNVLSVPAGKPRMGVPFLPRLGGIGPLLWRQLTTAVRSLKTIVLVLIFFGLFTLPMLLQLPSAPEGALPALLLAVLIASTLIVPPMLPFDFRSDLDRMPFLKSLPLPAWRIVVAELLTPVLVLSGVQLLILIILSLVTEFDSKLWGAAGLLLPINFLIFAVENFFFLLFPVRSLAGNPGDFQLMGRNILIWLAKMTVIGVALLPASLAGVLLFLITGQNLGAGITAALVVVLAIASATVPLLTWSFRRFDVARDTPPE